MKSKRQLQVAEMIKRNMGIVLQMEGSYIYGSAFVTVTQVKLTPDLALAKIYLSIYNADNKEEVLSKIRAATHSIKQSLVVRIKRHVRRIPTLSFYIDETLDEMYKLNALFDNLDNGSSEE